MIAFIRGKIQSKRPGFVIVDVHDLGYKIRINSAQFADTEIGQTAEFYIYQHVREDILALYGFRDVEELEMFELLLSVSGIGPKSALGVFAVAEVAEIKDVIVRGDPSLLTKVAGIGKKTAERIVLELRGKISPSAGGSAASSAAASGEEIDALIALGYSLAQARDALKSVSPEIRDSGNRIKEALKMIGKKP